MKNLQQKLLRTKLTEFKKVIVIIQCILVDRAAIGNYGYSYLCNLFEISNINS